MYLKEELQRVGLKATSSRLAILETFDNDCKPISAEEIFDSLKNKKVDQVTVYRTLGSLEEKGILKRVDLRKGAAYFELNHHHHHHIICTDCGAIEGIEICKVDILAKEVLKKSQRFNVVNDHALEFFGICNSCVKK